MEVTTQNIRVIRVQSKNRNKMIWKYVKRYSNATINFTTSLNEATDYSIIKIEDIVKDFNALSKKFGLDNVQLVFVKVLTEIEVIDIDGADYLEERRKQALSKLSLADVKALGLEAIATYHKLKFHNSDQEDEFIDIDDGKW